VVAARRVQGLPQRGEAWTKDHQEGRHARESYIQACWRKAEPHRPPRRRPREPLGIKAQGEGEQFQPKEPKEPWPASRG